MGQEGKGPVIRANIKVRGIVQGVGFRPFIHRQVSGYGLKGWVRNTSDGAEIEVEGPEGLIDRFAEELWTKKPLLALIEDVRIDKTDDLRGYDRFEIAGSRDLGRRNTLISPDVAVCEDCLRELRDPSDRRYRYPYINCTNCGPRFTIIKDVPYDRAKTTMAEFPMCGTCEGEYTNIENRRYHAEPTCCPDCGPGLIYCRADGRPANGDPVKLAAEDLKAHRIVAVKGLGGYHLACLFDDDETPARLRERKRRDEKPFAVMCRDLDAARKICEVDETEERLLLSGARPIVLLKKKDRGSLMNVSENGRVGVMLPYTPVHHLLFGEGLESLIMTSANLSDLPIIYKDDEALRELADIADGFLMGEREIHTRCDDSLVYGFDGKAYPVRRSRGYVPYPLRLQGADNMILACGAEQKASFCISREGSVFPSQHIGDLKNLQTFDNYSRQIAHFENMFSVRPQKLVCDLHPDYLSTSYAEERSKNEGIPLI
ncbi:MAG: carbamoyltransferase HypF, partial [Firmicutes bacterium]|nr:carbamoyltransferase HypF [Bacillota bacterium]